MTEKSKTLLTEKEAAEFLGVSASTLSTKRSVGGGPQFVKVLNSVRYRRSDLDAYIESRIFKNTAESKAALA